MYDVLFDLNVSLCDRFPALHPFAVRAQRWHDVLLIYKRLIRQKKPEEKSGAFERNGVIWKPATSDDWW